MQGSYESERVGSVKAVNGDEYKEDTDEEEEYKEPNQ